MEFGCCVVFCPCTAHLIRLQKQVYSGGFRPLRPLSVCRTCLDLQYNLMNPVARQQMVHISAASSLLLGVSLSVIHTRYDLTWIQVMKKKAFPSQTLLPYRGPSFTPTPLPGFCKTIKLGPKRLPYQVYFPLHFTSLHFTYFALLYSTEGE